MLRPLHDRVLVRPDAHQEIASLAGILIRNRVGLTESTKQLGRTGVVLAVGPGKTDPKGRVKPLNLEAGQRVAFGEFNYPVYADCILLQEADVIGVVEDAIL